MPFTKAKPLGNLSPASRRKHPKFNLDADHWSAFSWNAFFLCRTDDLAFEASGAQGEYQACSAVDALNEALEHYGPPEIFNTDQGSQFTSWAWIDRLKEAGVRISMDGKGRFMDNIFIERLWRSLKYECIYLHAFEGGAEVRAGIGKWIKFYNRDRPEDMIIA